MNGLRLRLVEEPLIVLPARDAMLLAHAPGAGFAIVAAAGQARIGLPGDDLAVFVAHAPAPDQAHTQRLTHPSRSSGRAERLRAPASPASTPAAPSPCGA